jgi:4-hydroxybenzoate polyprenyltransferase
MTAELGWVAKLGVIGVAVHLGWQTVSCNFDDAKNCRDTFYSNRYIGWILLAGLIIAKLMQ